MSLWITFSTCPVVGALDIHALQHQYLFWGRSKVRSGWKQDPSTANRDMPCLGIWTYFSFVSIVAQGGISRLKNWLLLRWPVSVCTYESFFGMVKGCVNTTATLQASDRLWQCCCKTKKATGHLRFEPASDKPKTYSSSELVHLLRAIGPL